MRKLIIIPLLLLSALCFSQEHVIDDFTGGLNTKDAAIKLENNETPFCQNVLFDEGNSLYSRQGYSEFATLPVSGNIYLVGEFIRQSGEKWLMVHVATYVYASDDNGASWVKVIDGLSEVYGGNSVTYVDEWWFTNGVDDVFSWNTSTTTVYGFIPQGKYIEVHNNQLFVANLPENYSAIFWCSSMNMAREIDGWRYSNSYIVGENEGDTVTGLKSEGSILTIQKQDSLWYMSGDGEYYDIPVKYTDVYGNMSQKSMSKYKRSPIFYSRQGLCSFNGGNIKQIDRNIEDLTKKANISVGTIVGKYWQQTTESDFRLGTSSNVSVTDGLLRTHPSADAIGANVTGMKEFQEETYIPNNGGVDGTNYILTSKNIIILPEATIDVDYTINDIKINLKRTSSDIYHSSMTVEIYNLQGTLLGSQEKWINDLGNGDWYTFVDTFTITVPQTFEVKAYRRHGTGNTVGGVDYLAYRVKEAGELSIRGGEGETGRVIGRTYGASNYDTYRREYGRINVSAANYVTTKANMEAAGWELSRKDWYNGFYKTVWVRALSYEDRANLALRYNYTLTPSSWGYFTSQKFSAGTNINSWKHFLTGDAGGNTTYQIKYATGSSALDYASWNAITNGSLIGATTSQYWTQWKATFNDKYQRTESVILRWFEVNGSDYQDVSAEFFKNRYHLAYSTYNYTNHIITIYDNNEKFTNWTLNAETLGVYDNQLLFGSSDKLYKLYDTWNDDGSAIDAIWESGYMSFGSPDRDKYLEYIGITHKGSGSLEVGYRGEYDTAWSTFTVTMRSDWDNALVKIINNSPSKYWRIRIRNNEVDEYFEVSEARLYHKYAPLRARE